MWMVARQLWVASVFLVSACDKPAIDASQSLVGAKRLPTARTLSREVIQINRGFGSPTSSLLSYELRPDNSLTITLTHRDHDTFKELTDGKEAFELSSGVAAQVRHDLWRLRPSTLQGIETPVRPADCPPPPTDTFPVAAVAFIAEGPKPGVEDDRLGVIDVPAQYTCDTRQGREARDLIGKVLRSFPRSKVAAEFDRRRPVVIIPGNAAA
jgi:hypothetical protein